MNNAAVPRPHRAGVRAWSMMIRAEAKMMRRDATALLMPLGLPILSVVMYGLIMTEGDEEVQPGVTVMDVYVLPVVLVMVVTLVAVMHFPGCLATYRKAQVLRDCQ